MQQSEETSDLFAAMAKAQAEIKNPGKNTKNTYYKNEYADLTSVLNAIRPVAAAHGLSFIQSVDMVDERVTIQSQVSHASGQWIRCSAMVPLPQQSKNVPQDIGIISTYIRRYQAQSMFCINAEEDTDAQTLSERQVSLDLDAKKAAHIDALLDSTRSNRAKFLEIYQVKKIEDLNDTQYHAAVKQLQEKKSKQARSK
jgi:hypothetical protein